MDRQSETAGDLRLSGPLTIRRAGELRSALASALETHRTITLDIEAGAQADISFVQLVLAAQVSARAAGKDIRLASPCEGSLRDVLTRGGFLAADERGFWTTGARRQ